MVGKLVHKQKIIKHVGGEGEQYTKNIKKKQNTQSRKQNVQNKKTNIKRIVKNTCNKFDVILTVYRR